MNWADAVTLLVCVALSSAWCVTAGREIGATYDEPFYVRQGLVYWRTGSNGELLSKGTMPLPVHACTLPVWLWESARGREFNTFTDFGEVLPLARLGTLPFWWALLGYGLLIGRSLGGPLAGRLSACLLACEPNLLGHTCLATTDIASTACTLAMLYHYRRGRESGWGLRVALPGVLYGVALLAKASALMFAPACMFFIEVSRRWGSMTHLGSARSLTWVRPWTIEILQVGVIGWVVAFAYCGSDWQPERSFVAFARSLESGPARDVLLPVADRLRVFPNAGVAMARQIKHNIQGHGVYLLGEFWPRAVWYYFPVALTMKMTPPALLALAATALLCPGRWRHWLGACALGLFVMTVNCRVQIGIRLVFPLLTMSLVGLSVALTGLMRDPARWRRVAGGVLAACLLIGSARDSLAVWPHGLSYVNALWGGTENGHLCLSDSNTDWGQGLPELAEWQRQAGADKLDVWYFGDDPAILTIPARWVHPHADKPADWGGFVERFRGRHLAVSTTLLYGSYLRDSETLEIISRLRSMTPAARTRTFFIYDFAAPTD